MSERSISFALFARDHNVVRTFGSISASASGLHAKVGLVASGMAGAMGGAAAVVTQKLLSMGTSAIKSGLQTAAGMEQAQIAFTTLLGSTTKAQRYLDDLSRFAATTPFELPGLVDSSRLLLGVGVDAQRVVPMLTDFGDAAGALGIQQEAFQRIMLATSQAISAGRFMTGDLNQIVNAGIPAWTLLARATGKTVPELRDLASHGKLLAKDVLPTLQAQMHKDFGGAMAKQSQTLSGLWSTLMDTFNQGMAKAIMPMAWMLRSVIPKAADVMGRALAGVGKSVEAFSAGVSGDTSSFTSGVAGALSRAGAAAGGIAQKIKPAFRDVREVLHQFGDVVHRGVVPALQGLGGRLLAFGETYAVPFARSLAARVTESATQLASSLAAALRAGDLSAVGRALGEAVAGKGNLLGDLLTRLLATAGQIDWVGLGIKIGKLAVPLLAGFAAGLLNFDLLGLLTGLARHWQDILMAVLAVAFTPAKILGKVGELLARIPLVGKLLAWGLEHFASFSKRLVGIAAGALGAIGRGFARGFAEIFPTTSGAIRRFFDSLVVRIYYQQIAIFNTGRKLIERLGAGVVGGAEAAGRAAGRAVVGIGRAMVAAARGIWSFAASIGGRVRSAVGDLSRVLWDAGVSVIRGFIGGIGSMFGSVKSTLGDLTGKLTSWKGPQDLDRRILVENGRLVMSGFIVGLKDGAARVRDYLRDFTRSLSRGIDLRGSVSDVASSARALVGGVRQGTHIAGGHVFSARFAEHIAAENRRLLALARQRDQVRDRLAAAQQRLSDLLQARSSYAANVASSVRQSAALSTISAADGQPITGSVILAGLRDRLARASQFFSAVKRLAALGLGKGLLDQVVQMGPDQGLPYASALIAGGRNLVGQVNGTQTAINATARGLGQFAGHQMYDQGIASARGLVAGLRSQERALAAQMRRLADVMVNEIKRRLGLQVSHGLGRKVGAAMVGGMDAIGAHVAATGARATAAAPRHRATKRAAAAHEGHTTVVVVQLDGREIGRATARGTWEELLRVKTRVGHLGLA